MAVDHFRKSFDNERYTDELLNPWQEVGRCKPESPWYGHSGETGRYAPIPGGAAIYQRKEE